MVDKEISGSAVLNQNKSNNATWHAKALACSFWIFEALKAFPFNSSIKIYSKLFLFFKKAFKNIQSFFLFFAQVSFYRFPSPMVSLSLSLSLFYLNFSSLSMTACCWMSCRLLKHWMVSSIKRLACLEFVCFCFEFLFWAYFI